jgi:predicted  nucleic acid-binding Zn-ribbon protein
MASLETLLVLQEHDTTADQLRHRHDTLVERAELASLQRQRSDLDVELTRVLAARDEVARQQKRLEDEVASIEEKVAAVHGTLYGGSVTSPRELQALQQDEDSLKRHQAAVEDKVIEQMEAAVPLDESLDALGTTEVQLQADTARCEEALAAAEAEVDAELAATTAERDEVAVTIPPDLLERYEQLRHDLGGIAVARLVGSNCGGCHLALPAVELDRIRHEPGDALVTCTECGRLLVH